MTVFLVACAQRTLPDDEGSDDQAGESDDSIAEDDDGDEGDGDEDDAGDQGEQGEDGMASYEECQSVDDCDLELYCVYPQGESGFCAFGCPASGADGCPSPSAGTAQPTCIEVDGQDVCALDCRGNRSCPSGMRCQAVDLGGTRTVLCF